MSRTLAFGLIALSLCAPVNISINSVFAQGQPTQRRARPQGQPLRVQKVSPALMRVLEDWYRGTSQIKTLEGNHSQYTYDEVFAVEKRAVGRFYYTTPDKGRIDITPAKIRAGEKSERFTRKKPRTRYALAAGDAQQWVCTGALIAKIDPRTRKGEKFNIPPKAQGRNIMDGPLPFLLGMPPKLALRRYNLELLRQTATEVWLRVKPKWQQDLQQYKEAKVVLSKTNFYLPSAIQMVDLAGNRETVYTFYQFTVNKGWLGKFLDGDPYVIPRNVKWEPTGGRNDGGRQVQQRKTNPNPGRASVGPRKFAANPKAPTLADFRGYPSKKVGDYLKKMGYQVEFRKGSVAKKKEHLYLVEDQYPAPKTPYEKGRKILLKVYVSAEDSKPQSRNAAKPPNRTASRR